VNVELIILILFQHWKEWSSKKPLKQLYEWKKLNLCEKMSVKKWSTYSVPYGWTCFQNSKEKNGGIKL